MTLEQKNQIIGILAAAKGDDLYRARRAFIGYDLSQKYGDSGKTRAQILAEYQAHEDRINDLIKAVKYAQP